jgi:dienelactone hydrolase
LLDGYSKEEFGLRSSEGHGIVHDVYTRGSGPVVIVIQELPGIGPSTLTLADRLVESGFTVVLPHLFGPLGKISLAGNLARVFCMRREFRLFAKKSGGPIVEWLRALCQATRAKHEVPGVGVIGMCLTGNFAISLMADNAVLAGVASQPSMPLGGSPRALHMSDAEIDAARSKLDQVGPMLAYRFAGDKLCKAEKFESIDTTFNDDQQRIKLTTLDGPGHSVLTLDFVAGDGSPTQAALNEVIDYFGAQLNG